MGRRTALVALLAAMAAGCNDANLAEPAGLGLEAARYLDLALNVMEFNSIRRLEIDWTEFRTATLDRAGDAKTPAETYPAIRDALDRIGDGHSFFRTPDDATGGSAASAGPLAVDPSAHLEGEIAYIDVPAFPGGGGEGDELAALYHRIIEGVDTTGVCGWVVDLRGNTGGNVWPMLAGIGPVLGDGEAGAFVYPDSAVQEWRYGNGLATLDGNVLAVASPFYDLADPTPPVAVLTDRQTASAGEGVAVAFRARPDTRSFGTATQGLSTGNAGFGMPDGAVIFLTVAWMADRDGEVYGEELSPDSMVAGAKTGERATDAVLDAALGWLESAHCR